MTELPEELSRGLTAYKAGGVSFGYVEQKIEAYAAECVKREREECARLADVPRIVPLDEKDRDASEAMNALLRMYLGGVAAAIRERGTE